MLSQIIVVGRLTADPEVKTIGDSECCNFTLACERDWRNKEGNKEVDYLDCVAWKNNSEFLNNYCKKGDTLVVAGRIQTKIKKDIEGKQSKWFDISIEKVSKAAGKREQVELSQAKPGKIEHELFEDDDEYPI